MDFEKSKIKLETELKQLKHEYENDIPKQIAEARDLGDLKENAGYHAARERMGFIKAKISQLNEQLEKISNIDITNISDDSIGFGSKVVLVELETNIETELQFVSEVEIDPLKSKISLATPYGKALSGKKAGEKVEVQIPAGTKKFYIKSFSTIHGNEFNAAN